MAATNRPRAGHVCEAIDGDRTRGEFREGVKCSDNGSAVTGADGALFDEQSVDRQAAVVPGTKPPAYPDALRASGIQGAVTVQFVMDTAGRVEPFSIQVSGSNNPLFSAAVRSALLGSRFRPAQVGGVPVRQLVQQSFSFVIQ